MNFGRVRKVNLSMNIQFELKGRKLMLEASLENDEILLKLYEEGGLIGIHHVEKGQVEGICRVCKNKEVFSPPNLIFVSARNYLPEEKIVPVMFFGRCKCGVDKEDIILYQDIDLMPFI